MLIFVRVFLFQFIVGFFSFLLLLCCESATASFRASLVPIHSTFGITTFVMAVATCCSGLTEKAFFVLRYGICTTQSICHLSHNVCIEFVFLLHPHALILTFFCNFNLSYHTITTAPTLSPRTQKTLQRRDLLQVGQVYRPQL